MRDTLAAPTPARLYGRLSATINAPGTLVVWQDEEGHEHTRTWPNALPGHRSPCRPDRSKGLRQHRCSRAHAELVEGYRAWKRHADQAAEDATLGYPEELAEYRQAHERPTLRAYLESRTQQADAA